LTIQNQKLVLRLLRKLLRVLLLLPVLRLRLPLPQKLLLQRKNS
jgi:hypothetical protein